MIVQNLMPVKYCYNTPNSHVGGPGGTAYVTGRSLNHYGLFTFKSFVSLWRNPGHALALPHSHCDFLSLSRSLVNHEHYQRSANHKRPHTMAPTRPRKQASEESGSSSSLQKRATSSGSDAPSTPKRSPIEKKPTGITLQQKQALIENLRLESTRFRPRHGLKSR